jgi:hypothetical protein
MRLKYCFIIFRMKNPFSLIFEFISESIHPIKLNAMFKIL